MAPRRANRSARSRVVVPLAELPVTKLYAGIKKRKGPKRQLLEQKPPAPPKKSPAAHSRKSYTIKYKLRVLAWLGSQCIPCSPSRFREPTVGETAKRFRISAKNIVRWRAEERAGKYLEVSASARRVGGGGQRRKWEEMERDLYDRFRRRRAEGKVVRRSWFRQNAVSLFQKVYGSQEEGLIRFRFSNGWFRSFLSWHQISLRAITNKASQLPSDYISTIISWLKFNRKNSQLRNEREGLGTLEVDGSEEEGGDEGRIYDSLNAVGRYGLSNICNMDQTPLPFEYLSGRTYNQVGDKTIWVQSSTQSGWDKRQATIQLTIFADGIPRVKPLLFFRGQGLGSSLAAEKRLYDNRVIVKFNSKAYANSTNMVEWLEDQLIPVLDGKPTLIALDLFGGHKTEEVLDTMKAHDITVSVIPGGCTSLLQPLDVSINRPFKDILKVSLFHIHYLHSQCTLKLHKHSPYPNS